MRTVIPNARRGSPRTAWELVLAHYAVQQRITDELRAAVQSPEVKTKLDLAGTEPTGLGPDEFTAAYKRDLPVWEKAVKDSGATLA